MAIDHLSKFKGGRGRRGGLTGAFKKNYKLLHFLSPKDRKQAVKDLHKYSKGGGIAARAGTHGYKSELETVYGKWRRNRKDRINRAEARMIKRELEKYQSRIEDDPRHPRGSRDYFRETHPSERSKDVPRPGGDVRPGSFGSADGLPKGPVQPPSFDGGFDNGFGGSDGGGDTDSNVGPSEGSGYRDF